MIGSVLLSVPAMALAQSATRSVRIGNLFGDAKRVHEGAALRDGLRELGDAEGRNLVIERPCAEQRSQLLPGYAREFVSMNLDAVISPCTPTTRIARHALGSAPGSTPITLAAVAEVVALAARHRLPVIDGLREYVDEAA